MNPVPLPRELFAHHAFHSSALAQNTVLALGLAVFCVFSSQEGDESPGAREMIEPVNAEEFITQPERRKPEQFRYVKLRINARDARLTLIRPEHNLLNAAM